VPNWCSNKLIVGATNEKDLDDFVSKMGGEDEDGDVREFSFNALVPRPKTESTNWYDWNCNNWGTKWDASEPSVYISDEDFKVDITFDTAWSPPIEWLQKVAPQFPKLQFTLLYYEGGMGFAGELEYEEGQEYRHSQYGSDDEGYWNIATDGMDDDEIEERATEYIQDTALSDWYYDFNRLVEIIGEEKKAELENLILIKKLAGEMEYSKSDEYSGEDIEDIVEQLMGTENFIKFLIEDFKKKNVLKRYAC